MSAILFLSIYLCSGTGVNDLLKISTLISHYYETMQQDKTVSFSRFLVMHYITDDLNDKDNDQDKQMPFKSHELCLSNMALSYMPNYDIAAIIHPPFVTNKIDFSIANDPFALPKQHDLVWHPPNYS